MEQLPEKLIIGAIGSVLGALIVYLGQVGFQLGKGARERNRHARTRELEAWQSMGAGIRQSITNIYLFAILRYLFLGNLLWLVPEVLEAPAKAMDIYYEIFVGTVVVCKGGALMCFFLGLGRILRYLKLRATDGDITEKH